MATKLDANIHALARAGTTLIGTGPLVRPFAVIRKGLAANDNLVRARYVESSMHGPIIGAGIGARATLLADVVTVDREIVSQAGLVARNFDPETLATGIPERPVEMRA